MQPASLDDLEWLSEQGYPAGDVLGVEPRGAQVAIALVDRDEDGLGKIDDDGTPSMKLLLLDSPAALEVIAEAVEFAAASDEG